jgi:uncharacterized protein with ParB-like and HNH nuclease domain
MSADRLRNLLLSNYRGPTSLSPADWISRGHDNEQIKEPQNNSMKKIEGSPTTLRKLLTGVKYTVHYYQREYRWGKKQMEELLEDLTSEFLEFYDESHPRKAVQDYGHYFLGSIVLTEKDRAIIDGQQRLTSLTLLLI